jgi:hypothetical protein
VLHLSGTYFFYSRRDTFPIQQRHPMWITSLNITWLVHSSLWGIFMVDPSILPCPIVWWNVCMAVTSAAAAMVVRLILLLFHFEATGMYVHDNYFRFLNIVIIYFCIVY